jgi:hypothetical protein
VDVGVDFGGWLVWFLIIIHHRWQPFSPDFVNKPARGRRKLSAWGQPQRLSQNQKKSYPALGRGITLTGTLPRPYEFKSLQMGEINMSDICQNDSLSLASFFHTLLQSLPKDRGNYLRRVGALPQPQRLPQNQKKNIPRSVEVVPLRALYLDPTNLNS